MATKTKTSRRGKKISVKTKKFSFEADMPDKERVRDTSKLTAKQQYKLGMKDARTKRAEIRGKTARAASYASAAEGVARDNENAAALAQLWNPAYAEGGSDDESGGANSDLTKKDPQSKPQSDSPQWNGW